MLLNTGKKDKKGNAIYLNKLTGKEEKAQRITGSVTKKIPGYAFSFVFNPFKNPQLKF